MDGRAPSAARARHLPQQGNPRHRWRAAALCLPGRPYDDGQRLGLAMEGRREAHEQAGLHRPQSRRRQPQARLRRLSEVSRPDIILKLDLANPAWRQTLPPARSVAADAPVAACAFSRDGATVAFALGDGRVRLLPSDVNAAEIPAADPLHGGAVLALVGDPAGDGFVSGGDDGRLLRIGANGTASELV